MERWRESTCGLLNTGTIDATARGRDAPACSRLAVRYPGFLVEMPRQRLLEALQGRQPLVGNRRLVLL